MNREQLEESLRIASDALERIAAGEFDPVKGEAQEIASAAIQAMNDIDEDDEIGAY